MVVYFWTATNLVERWIVAAMFTSNDAVLLFSLRPSLNRVDAQLDELIYEAFPLKPRLPERSKSCYVL